MESQWGTCARQRIRKRSCFTESPKLAGQLWPQNESQKMHVLLTDYSVARCNNLLAIPGHSAGHREKKLSFTTLTHSSPCVDDDKPKVVWKLLIALGESFSFFVAFLLYFTVHVEQDVRVRTETWFLFFYFRFVQSARTYIVRSYSATFSVPVPVYSGRWCIEKIHMVEDRSGRRKFSSPFVSICSRFAFHRMCSGRGRMACTRSNRRVLG